MLFYLLTPSTILHVPANAATSIAIQKRLENKVPISISVRWLEDAVAGLFLHFTDTPQQALRR